MLRVTIVRLLGTEANAEMILSARTAAADFSRVFFLVATRFFDASLFLHFDDLTTMSRIFFL